MPELDSWSDRIPVLNPLAYKVIMGRFTHESSRPYLSVRSLSEGIKVIVAEALPERKEDFFGYVNPAI